MCVCVCVITVGEPNRSFGMEQIKMVQSEMNLHQKYAHTSLFCGNLFSLFHPLCIGKFAVGKLELHIGDFACERVKPVTFEVAVGNSLFMSTALFCLCC